jgi:DNA-binding protein YbaB
MGFLDQMKQLQEVKSKMDEVKKRLDTVEVSLENDYVKVTATGNRKIKGVEIKRTDDVVLLQQKITALTNEVLEKAENVMQSEMMAVTKGMLPNIPGMG